MDKQQKQKLEQLRLIEQLNNLYENLEMFWNIKFNKAFREHNQKEVKWNYAIILSSLQHYFTNVIEDKEVCELFLTAVKVKLRDENCNFKEK